MLRKIEIIHKSFSSKTVQHYIFNAEVLGFQEGETENQIIFRFIIPPDKNKNFSYYRQYMSTDEVTFTYEGVKYFAILGYEKEKYQINLLIRKKVMSLDCEEHVFFDLRI